MATLTSSLIVSLIDRVTAPSRAISGALNRLNSIQERNSQRLDAVRGRMLEAGAVAYGLARAIGAPVNAATEFETKLEDIGQKINTPVSKLPELGAAIRAVGRDTMQSADAIAEGMDVLAGMGASGEDALGLLPAIGRAATAYNASIDDLSQAGYSTLSNLKVPADQFARALDAMAEAGKAGAFELKDMAQYFPTLGAGYQALGQTGVPAVADLSAALQIVRKGTGDSASAATNLSNILQKMRAPQTVKAFSKMGVDLEKELKKAAKKGMTPIEAIAEVTSKALKGDLSRIGYLFQDAQVQQGIRPLVQNIEEYRRIRAEALAAQGVVETDYQRRLQTGALATKRWRVALEAVSLSIGTALLPALTTLADDLVPIINRMAAWAEAHPALTRAIIATTAGLVALRVAAIAAQFSLLWMRGGVIAAAIAGLRTLTGVGRVASLALLPLTAGLRGLRTAMIGYAAAAAVGGQGTALAMMARGLLGLLNPVRLVTVAFRLMRVALISTGIGAIALGIAAAGTWIYNNWSNIGVAFEAFKGAFMRAIEPVMPVLQPVIDVIGRLWSAVSNLLGPVDGLGAGWARAGMAAGEFVGKIVVAAVELPGKIAEMVRQMIAAITSLASEMAAAGTQLMNALLEGIKAGAQAVLEYVSGVGARIRDSISSAASGAWSNIKGSLGFGGAAAPESAAVTAANAAAGNLEKRASGGPVAPGTPYLVGEEGPEIVTFPQAGLVHNAIKTASFMRNAALASAVALPAAASPGPAGGATTGRTEVNVGGIKIQIIAQPNQSARELADEVGRELTLRLNALSRGAFSDGAN